MKSSHWYLQGYCHRRNDFRLFRLSRMSNLQMQEELCTAGLSKRLRRYRHLEALQTKIKIRIHKSVMDRVLDFCSYEDFSPAGEEHYIVSFPFIENEILLRYSFKFRG